MFDDFFNSYDPNAGPGIDWGPQIDPNQEPPSDDDMRRYEEVGESLDRYIDSGYGGNLDSVPTTPDGLWFDLSYDLRSGNEDAWALMWDVAGAVLGIDNIFNDDVWGRLAFDSVMDAVFGESDWNWDGEWSECPEDDDYL